MSLTNELAKKRKMAMEENIQPVSINGCKIEKQAPILTRSRKNN